MSDKCIPILHLKKLRRNRTRHTAAKYWLSRSFHVMILPLTCNCKPLCSPLHAFLCWLTNLSPIPELGAKSHKQTWVPFPAAGPHFLLQGTNLWPCYPWPIVCYPDAECAWSCQHARKHLAGRKEGGKKVQCMCVASYLK